MGNPQIILFACLAASAAGAPAYAQRWGREPQPRSGVCFYKETNFRGDYFCAGAGENLSAVPDGMNDKISSIKVFGDAEVTLFKDVRFEGRSTRFDGDVRNLKEIGWNDAISSIRVRGFGSGYGGNRPGGGYARPADADRIVRRAYEDLLGREPDPVGMRTYRSHIIDDGWTEAQVREELRRSQEYRERGPEYRQRTPESRDRGTMTYERAEDVVRRAYQSVLRREPDPASRPFVDRVMRDHWTQQDVERELRKSEEYRNKRR